MHQEAGICLLSQAIKYKIDKYGRKHSNPYLRRRSSSEISLHRLEVIALLDLGLALAAHGAAQLLARIRGL